MWFHNDKPFTSECIENYKGFVYIITDNINNKKYIGQKRFWKKITRPPLKGKKRRRIEWVESNWQEYYGSNEELNLLVESNTDPKRFKREILHLCNSTGEMNYLEAKEQFDRDVLLNDDYYNGIIQTRIHASHVKSLKK